MKPYKHRITTNDSRRPILTSATPSTVLMELLVGTLIAAAISNNAASLSKIISSADASANKSRHEMALSYLYGQDIFRDCRGEHWYK